MRADEKFYLRTCLTDFETRNSKDPNKKLGGYLLDLGQYHLDSRGYGKTASGMIVLTPAAQAFAATLRQECGHLLNGEINEIHVIDSLIAYTEKYYGEAKEDVISLFKEAKKHISFY